MAAGMTFSQVAQRLTAAADMSIGRVTLYTQDRILIGRDTLNKTVTMPIRKLALLYRVTLLTTAPLLVSPKLPCQ